jgi:hypothetical protein
LWTHVYVTFSNSFVSQIVACCCFQKRHSYRDNLMWVTYLVVWYNSAYTLYTHTHTFREICEYFISKMPHTIFTLFVSVPSNSLRKLLEFFTNWKMTTEFILVPFFSLWQFFFIITSESTFSSFLNQGS